MLAKERRTALDKFEQTVKEGFVKQNEFRGSLSDLGLTMSTRREAEQTAEAWNKRFDELSKQMSEVRSRLDVGPQELRTLVATQATTLGRQQGISASAGALFAGGTLFCGLAAIIIAIILH